MESRGRAIRRFAANVLLLLSLSLGCNGEVCGRKVCEYTLVIRHAQTMTTWIEGKAYSVALNGTQLVVVENSLRRAVDFPDRDDIFGRVVDPSDVITADGYSRDIITVNDHFPGPTIEVMDNAKVVVRVVNEMTTEAVTIHWHGMHQRHNFHMDGVAYITQCPIQPGQSFTYRFIADPPGTHWYHSHIAGQRMDGLYGFLIVHVKPPIATELPIFVTDWYHVGHIQQDTHDGFRIQRPGSGDHMINDVEREYFVDCAHVSGLTYVSSLIGGRGRWPEDQPYPLAEYKLSRCDANRVRMVAASTQFVYEVKVDGHSLRLVALDGYPTRPLDIHSCMIHPGESVDFELIPDPGTPRVGRYWLRAQTISAGIGPNVDIQRWNVTHEARAIVTYDKLSGLGPTSTGRQCLSDDKCLIFNCPYAAYPPERNRTCIPYSQVHSVYSRAYLADHYGLTESNANLWTTFENVRLTKDATAINSRGFLPPRALLLPGEPGNDKYITECIPSTCDTEECLCTYVKQLPFNSTIQASTSAQLFLQLYTLCDIDITHVLYCMSIVDYFHRVL